jgi:hypothetical protein
VKEKNDVPPMDGREGSVFSRESKFKLRRRKKGERRVVLLPSVSFHLIDCSTITVTITITIVPYTNC